jgi:hypothetical protein
VTLSTTDNPPQTKPDDFLVEIALRCLRQKLSASGAEVRYSILALPWTDGWCVAGPTAASPHVLIDRTGSMYLPDVGAPLEASLRAFTRGNRTSAPPFRLPAAETPPATTRKP